VPHGNTLDEYLACAAALAMVGPKITTLCVIEEIEELFGISRIATAKELYRLVGADRQIHMSGVSEDLAELRSPWVKTHVRSLDTAKFVVWGLNGDEITDWGDAPQYPGRKRFGGRWGYFNYETDDTNAIASARFNVAHVTER